VLDKDGLASLVAELIRRPGHEKVRANVWQLLIQALDIPREEIDFEKRLVQGRMDALLGNTVFEFKRDLRSEMVDAQVQLRLYMRQRSEQTGKGHIGIAPTGWTSSRTSLL
jgi:hypothetical protein